MDDEIASDRGLVVSRAEFHQGLFELKSELKNDMKALELALRRDFEARFSHIEARMSDLHGSLSRWVLTCMMAQTAVIAGAIYFALGHLAR